MNKQPKKNAFVLLSTDIGSMIVNRFDYCVTPQGVFGVGHQLFEYSMYDAYEIELGCNILSIYREMRGDGVVALDCGANIGVNSIAWGRHMTGWGMVFSIEAQERVYYALAGNVALNNLFNVKATLAAVSDKPGILEIPVLNYFQPTSFGSVELEILDNQEYIGQQLNYEKGKGQYVTQITVDSVNLSRLDFLKIDVEGMEIKVLRGAKESIIRHKPCIYIEKIKSNSNDITDFLKNLGYKIYDFGSNFICFNVQDNDYFVEKFEFLRGPVN